MVLFWACVIKRAFTRAALPEVTLRVPVLVQVCSACRHLVLRPSQTVPTPTSIPAPTQTRTPNLGRAHLCRSAQTFSASLGGVLPASGGLGSGPGVEWGPSRVAGEEGRDW